jgi:shikimate 5-dehydrogenase
LQSAWWQKAWCGSAWKGALMVELVRQKRESAAWYADACAGQPHSLKADGVGMLVEQAAEAWVWWRGVRPPTDEVIRQLTVPLR